MFHHPARGLARTGEGGRVGAAHERRGRGVAEEHGGVEVVRVGHRRKRLGGDDEDARGRVALQDVVRVSQGVEIPGAGGQHVVRGHLGLRAVLAQLGQHKRRGGWGDGGGRGGGADHGGEVGRLQAGGVERAARGGGGEGDDRLAGGEVAALADAGELGDLLGVMAGEARGDLGVGHQLAAGFRGDGDDAGGHRTGAAGGSRNLHGRGAPRERGHAGLLAGGAAAVCGGVLQANGDERGADFDALALGHE